MEANYPRNVKVVEVVLVGMDFQRTSARRFSAAFSGMVIVLL